MLISLKTIAEEKKVDERIERTKAKNRTRPTVKQDSPVEETLLIRQRLRNLCELAIAIGQKEGLLHGPMKVGKMVTDNDPNHCQATKSQQDSTGK